ncbi:hypothetical protein OFO10_07405 [Campylobacter sp. VBCF_06 NA8]|uniref:hypothetical protein n=1 Tax=unclassified Campylobacter TaxID=2593542 RepID=UPI0022E9DF3F|nr:MULTISPECIES: hypothetical protein [unclassified Campylobacter]MDA3046980.1 hypothetical protein [Campylobacter sp. VBCF_06 NA8]MDA3057974.1 hypothetical protein [Campylobacter sp. VBCF_04 NA7]MDA3059249.1 hypothetical protein [Campylobacter sp. VBCF_05 NA6]
MKKLVIVAILSVFAFGEGGCKNKFAQEKIERLKGEVMDNFTTLREIKCENNILTHDSILSVDLEKMGEKEKSNFLFFIGEIVKNRYCNSEDFVNIRNANLTFKRIIKTQNLDNTYEYEVSNKDCLR